MEAAQWEGGSTLWLHSFGVGISIPKAVLFFAALFPQILPAQSNWSVLALLASTFVAVKFTGLLSTRSELNASSDCSASPRMRGARGCRPA